VKIKRTDPAEPKLWLTDFDKHENGYNGLHKGFQYTVAQKSNKQEPTHYMWTDCGKAKKQSSQL
jgi:hypothetical protein